MPVDLSGLENPSVLLTAVGGIIVMILIVLLYWCALCLTAIDNASPNSIKALSEKNAAAERAGTIKNNSARYSKRLKACLLFHTVAIVLLTNICYLVPIAKGLDSFLKNSSLSISLSALLLGILLCVLLLSAIYLIPARTAANAPEKILLRMSRLIILWSVLFLPLSLLGNAFSALMCRILTKEEKQDTPKENPTEEKILMMVDEGEVNGTIEVNTKSMIENVFDFDDTTVGEIMTHRKDIIAVREDDTLTKLRQLAIESGRSRIPVYHDDIDDIIGIIYVKDLLEYVGMSNLPETLPRNIIHTAVYVPASKSCSEMFRYMTAHKTQIAVVVDEFGGTGGLITMEDLIESILGNIQDEYDNEDDSIRKVNEYSFQVDGATSLDEIEELTGISFEEDENDTIAGIMLDRMGHIPKAGEHPSIMINGTRFTVLEVEQRRISRVLIVKNHTKKNT